MNAALRSVTEEDRGSGPRLVGGHAHRVHADPYAQILALDGRTLAARALGTLAFVGLAVELHALLRLWVAGLTRMSTALDHVPPLWTVIACAAGGLASFIVPARGDARRVWNVIGIVAVFLATAVGATIVLMMAVPQMAVGVRTELLVETRALVSGAFAGMVAYAVLSAIGGLSSTTRLVSAIVLGVATMVPVAIVGHIMASARDDAAESLPIDVMLDEPPPPPPPPSAEPEEVKPEPPKAVPLPLPTAAPLPAPAQAAKVVAVEPDPNKPLDFTNTIIQGTANEYAGGITSSEGTSNTAMRNVGAQNGGVPTANGNEANAPAQVQQAPRVSRARPAGLMSHDWRCPFPPEADTAQIDEALVILEITVRPDGTPGTVRILRDPGNGFGRMAYQCAMRQRFVTALDADGNSIQGVVRAPVHFNR